MHQQAPHSSSVNHHHTRPSHADAIGPIRSAPCQLVRLAGPPPCLCGLSLSTRGTTSERSFGDAECWKMISISSSAGAPHTPPEEENNNNNRATERESESAKTFYISKPVRNFYGLLQWRHSHVDGGGEPTVSALAYEVWALVVQRVGSWGFSTQASLTSQTIIAPARARKRALPPVVEIRAGEKAGAWDRRWWQWPRLKQRSATHTRGRL